jgi:hypothetical protein
VQYLVDKKDKNMDAKPKMKENSSDEREKFDDEDSDRAYDVATSLAEMVFYDQEHLKGLMSAVQKSQDPSQVVGAAVGQVMLVAYNKANQADLQIDDRVWAADEGVLDTIVNEAVEFVSQAGAQVNPEAVKSVALKVLQDSPKPGEQPQQPQPMNGVPQR